MNYEQLDALALAHLIRKKSVSPKELLEEAIARIERFDGKLNSVVWRSFERARKEVEQAQPYADPEAPFYGIPFLIKDLMAQDEGEPCSSSTKLMESWRAPCNSSLVERYKEAGLLILGRTNTPEFGIYAVTEPELRGPTRNPWDLSRTPGGSSGGSAAAVAARYVPMAHAGDGGGSIRIPASHCGLFGMKPSRARNPSGPFVGERWDGLVQEHVLTRSVRDSAAMLDMTQGSDLGAPYQIKPPRGSYLQNVLEGANGKGPRLRIAFSTEPLFGDSVHPDNVAATVAAARLAESLGHQVVEAMPPFDKETLIMAYFTILAANVSMAVHEAAAYANTSPKASDFEPTTWLLHIIGSKLSAREHVEALKQVHLAHRRIAPFFVHHDVFLTPTAAAPPVEIGTFKPSAIQKLLIAGISRFPARVLLMQVIEVLGKTAMNATPNTMLFNMTGQPAMSMPLFWNDDGLPIGTHWVGRFGDEASLFQLAGELEMALPWAQRMPEFLSSPPKTL